MLLSILFVGQNKFVNLVAGLEIISIGFLIYGITTNSLLGLVLGLPSANFYTIDYVPLFPYFGIVLIGIFMGKTLYANGQRVFTLPKINFDFPPTSYFIDLGKIRFNLFGASTDHY